MATKNQIVEQDRQSELRRTEAAATIIDHVAGPGNLDDDTGRGIAVDVLTTLADAIDDEVADVAALRRKGWQSTMKAHVTTAEIVRTWRDLLIAYTPPAGRPEPRPPAEIAVDHRAATPAELDARLVEAFPDIGVPERHIRTTVESAIADGASEGDGTRGPVYGALCGSGTGSWTHRGGANCPTCIATYDDEHGPYTGPGPWKDGPVTPEVARAMREAGPFTAPPTGGTKVEIDGQDVTTDVTAVTIEAGAVPAFISPTESLLQPVTQPLVDSMPTIVEPSGPQARPRMTPEQVRAHGLARARGAKHRSVSQVTGHADCGTRYAIDDLEAPAWWNVGGKALHRCVEQINRWVADGADLAMAEKIGGIIPSDERFQQAFDIEIGDQCNASTYVAEQWRVANRGKENYDWWRVEGPVMVQRYVEWLLGRLADGWEIARIGQVLGVGSLPIIEFECHLDVGAPVPNLSIVDLALIHPMHQILEVIDIKAGASAPKDTFQLGVYGWALLAAGIAGFIPAPDYSNVRGRYWRARSGTCVPEEEKAGWPVLALHPWPNVVDRYRTMDAMERQGFYQPNVTSFCGGCGVRDLCPAQANA